MRREAGASVWKYHPRGGGGGDSAGLCEQAHTWTLSGGLISADDLLRLSDLWGETGAPAERSRTSHVVTLQWEETQRARGPLISISG